MRGMCFNKRCRDVPKPNRSLSAIVRQQYDKRGAKHDDIVSPYMSGMSNVQYCPVSSYVHGCWVNIVNNPTDPTLLNYSRVWSVVWHCIRYCRVLKCHMRGNRLTSNHMDNGRTLPDTGHLPSAGIRLIYWELASRRWEGNDALLCALV